MPQIVVRIPHQLDRDTAKARIMNLVEHLCRQHSGQVVGHLWVGDQLEFQVRARGLKLSGRVQVTADEVEIAVQAPAWFFPFRSQLRDALLEQGREVLATGLVAGLLFHQLSKGESRDPDPD